MSKLHHQNHGPMKVVHVKRQPPVRMSRLFDDFTSTSHVPIHHSRL
ncbi:7632_t:CDS:1, partial [Paraglomus brasilianum]